MKKLKLHKISALTALLILAAGCGNYLSENPDNRVELNTVEKAAQLLTNAYPSGGYLFTEWMGDLVNYIPSTTKLTNNNQAYNWEDFTGDAQDTPANFWQAAYDAISHSNAVLSVIDNIDGDEAKKAAVKGEALLTRAYGHFMLVNIFGKQYDKTKAATDLGIPYVLEPETEFIKKYKRNTIAETYDLIEKDILDGLKLVDDSYYANSGKYHFTKNAALALASRFYFFKEDYTNCVKYSTQMLGTNPDVFVKDLPTIQANKIDSDDFIRKYHAPGDPSNLLLMRWVTNFHIPNYGYWPSGSTYRSIFNTGPFNGDLRSDPAFIAGSSSSESGGVAAARFEFLFERSSITSNVGFNYTIFIGFRGEEVLLNRAESNVMLGNINDAINDLQYLASKRYTGNPVITLTLLKNTYGTASSQTAVMDYIQEERIKEFIHEGIRWFDIKRFEIPVTHTLADGSTITLTAKDKRKVIQIPQAAIDVGGLEPNPR